MSRKLAQLANLADGTEARTLVRQLNQVLLSQGSAYQVEEVAGGFQLLTRPEYARWLRQIHQRPDESRLSGPALETLSVVAYRQPALRAEVEAIRGVQCGEMLRQLMERDMVRIVGRSEELGRPFLYGTTRRFLQVFGLRHLDELPRADVLRGAAVESVVTLAATADSLVLGVDQKESDVNVANFVQSQEAASEETEDAVVRGLSVTGEHALVEDSFDDDEYDEEDEEYEDEDEDEEEYEDDEYDDEEEDDEEYEDEDDEEEFEEDEEFEDEEWEEVDDDEDEEDEEYDDEDEDFEDDDYEDDDDEEDEDDEDWDDDDYEEEDDEL